MNELFEKAKKKFPKGSVVESPNGEVFTVSKDEWTTPDKNDWIDGVYYKGVDWGIDEGEYSDILAMGDGESRGYYLFKGGVWGKLLNNKI